MLHYYLHIFKKLSFYKILNAVKLYVSFYLSKAFKKPIILGLPISISFEPTTSCNLRCPQCPSGLRSFTRPIGMLDETNFINQINQLKKHLFSIIFYFQGEPFLNPEFLKMVKYANSKNLYTITSTNAHYINAQVANDIVKSGLNKLIISIDGATQEVYENYRVGGALAKVLEGTKQIVSAKKALKAKHLWILWQFVVFKSNEHQIKDIRDLALSYGVDELTIKTAQLYNFEEAHDLVPQNQNYARYILKNGKYQIKNKLLNQCWRMWISCVITWDGKIVPCCFDKDAKYQLGNLFKSDFKTIWKSESYNKFRQLILKSRGEIDICKNCTEGTKVWAD